MSEQLQQLVDRVAARAAMPPTHPDEDVRRGRAALVRRRRGATAVGVLAAGAVVVGSLAVGGADEPRRSGQGPAVGTPTAEPAPAPAPGTSDALVAAVAAVLDPTGDRVVPVSGWSSPVERAGQVVMVSTQLGWEQDGGRPPLRIHVRVAASAADAEWGCEDRCTLTSYDVDGLTAWTAPRNDLGLTGTLLVRGDDTAVALDVPPRLIASGEVTRADIDRVLTSPDVTLPPGTRTGPAPVPGEVVDRIALDALPGLEVTTPSTDLHPAGSGLRGGAEVSWQADPAAWAEDTCFWSRCEVRVVDGVRLEVSRETHRGGPFAGYVAVEHQGPVWRTRVLVPEGAVPLTELVPLLTDARWPR